MFDLLLGLKLHLKNNHTLFTWPDLKIVHICLQKWVGCDQLHRLHKYTVCHDVTVANPNCREYWPPTEDGGGAASAERKADRPV